MNKKLAACAAGFAREAGAEATLIDLRDFPMPLYDGDLEAASGVPEHARRLKALMKQHHGLVIACPEYNSSITPLLKNAIDWCSRREEGEQALECFQGKVAGLLSASAGALGGLRGLVTVRSILSSIGVLVLPNQFALSKADGAFGADGSLTDEKTRAAVRSVSADVVTTARKLHG
jgi:NAD(P)H-dependent FMN reductase